MRIDITFKDNTGPGKKNITCAPAKKTSNYPRTKHTHAYSMQKKKKLCQSHSHGGKFVLSIFTNWDWSDKKNNEKGLPNLDNIWKANKIIVLKNSR